MIFKIIRISKIMELLDNWKIDLQSKEDKYYKKSYRSNKKYYALTVVGLSIPILGTLLSQVLSDEYEIKTSSSVCFACSAVNTVIMNTFKFKVQSNEYKNTALNYSELINEIETIQLLNILDPNIDTLIKNIRNRINKLDAQAPI